MNPLVAEQALERYKGRHVTVMGLGTFGGGVAAVRFLAQCGARVSITDLRSEEQLADSLALLQDVRLERVKLGGHPEELFTDCDLLVVNPAVRPDDALVRAATASGALITSELELFCHHNPAAVIGVTGSNGKSTTTALIHHLLARASRGTGRRVWLGGNIGTSLLPELDAIGRNDLVVLELSSFQLERLRHQAFRVHLAVITNLSPNHLDWHGSMDAYRRAKQGVLDGQQARDLAVLPDDPGPLAEWRPRGQVMRFGLQDSGEDGAFLEAQTLVLRSSGQRSSLGLRRGHDSRGTDPPGDPVGRSRAGSAGVMEEAVRIHIPRQLPGDHNRLNVAAASAAVWWMGGEPDEFEAGLVSFEGLPHRLQLVVEHGGRRFIDDSIATTPESALRALQVYPGSTVVLAGGYDKGVDLTELARAIARTTRAAVLMGQTASFLRDEILSTSGRTCRTVYCGRDFPDCFHHAVALSEPGDIVLLSPGCASYGWFQDFRDRGRQFAAMAREWNERS